MKQVVCREDIQAEMDIFRDMQYKIQTLEGKVSMLQDRVDLLEAKNRIDVGLGTPINAPARTWDVPHMYWWDAISDAAERIRQDWHWDINDDWTLTFVRD